MNWRTLDFNYYLLFNFFWHLNHSVKKSILLSSENQKSVYLTIKQAQAPGTGEVQDFKGSFNDMIKNVMIQCVPKI